MCVCVGPPEFAELPGLRPGTGHGRPIGRVSRAGCSFSTHYLVQTAKVLVVIMEFRLVVTVAFPNIWAISVFESTTLLFLIIGQLNKPSRRNSFVASSCIFPAPTRRSQKVARNTATCPPVFFSLPPLTHKGGLPGQAEISPFCSIYAEFPCVVQGPRV